MSTSTPAVTGREPFTGTGIFNVYCRADGVAVIVMDTPGRPVNLLTEDFAAELGTVLDRIAAEPIIAASVLRSGKGGFMAGADVERLAACRDETEARELSAGAQALMDRVEVCPKPVVAAVHGACLGGGLELALACAERVAADDAVLGVPEIRLGLLPGAGGTVRLPRAIGAREALDLILTGRRIGAASAQRRGLVDEVTRPWLLEEAAAQHAKRLADHAGDTPSLLDRLRRLLDPDELETLALDENAAGRALLFGQVAKRARHRSRGNYPAPEAALDVVRTGLQDGPAAGLDAERQAFGRLAMTPASRQLVGVFLGQKRLEREADERVKRDGAPPARRLTVVGAGFMGGAIAAVSVEGGLLVRLKDVDDGAVGRGLHAVRRILEERVGQGRMDRREAERRIMMITATTGSRGVGAGDLVIEAVPEVLGLKQEVLGAIERQCPARTILASNTSSIPIDRLADALERPERMVGMHYFSPVERMPLIEIVRGPRTGPAALATALHVARLQRKTPVIVNDGPGFYTTRILAPYLLEAVEVLSEGHTPRVIDEALEDFGFPVGPMELADEVGIVVAGKIVGVLGEAFGERMAAPGALHRMIDEKRTGRAAGHGFYRYEGGKRKDDDGLLERLGIKASADTPPPGAIGWRCGLRMIDEAVRCLDEGIIASPADGDLAAVLGLGFPPFRGGPFRLVDDEGAVAIVTRMQPLRERHGPRFEPCPRLREMAADPGRRFYGEPDRA